MTFRVVIIPPRDILDAIDDAATRAPKLVESAYRRAVRGVGQRAVKALAQAPGPVKYPIRWKSERQRRAFFATNGFGKGIPYRRSGELSAGWKYRVITDRDGGALTVFNDVSYTRFVQGDDAQPFHLNTGWVQAAPTLRRFEAEAEDILIETWFTLTDPFAGVRR